MYLPHGFGVARNIRSNEPIGETTQTKGRIRLKKYVTTEEQITWYVERGGLRVV